MKILGAGSLSFTTVASTETTCPTFWPFNIFVSLLTSVFRLLHRPTPKITPYIITRGHYHPFQRLQHFLDALRISNPLTLPLLKWNPSHHPHFPLYAAWIPDLSSCSLASILPYLAHLSTCHPCLAKSQLCLNSIPCFLSSQTQAIV